MKRDGRIFDHKTLEAIRMMAIERIREGEPPHEVISSYGFCRTTIYKWLRKASGRGHGLRALRSRKSSGRPSKLTPRQRRQVYWWIHGHDPRRYDFDFGLWTRKIVGELIEQRFQVHLSLSQIGELLSQLKLTPQKPLMRAYERDPKAIEKWQRTTWPKLANRAKRRGAEIYFWDESGFRADVIQGRTWGAKAQTPVVRMPGKRQSVSAASAINARGGFWFVTYKGAMTATLFLTLLKKLMKHRKKPLLLVLDNLPAHQAKMVHDYVASTKGRIELHYLPKYAPELNPDELVWNYVKSNGTSKHPLSRGESLHTRIESDLLHLQHHPALIRAFFHEPHVAYLSA
jgi:transposase